MSGRRAIFFSSMIATNCRQAGGCSDARPGRLQRPQVRELVAVAASRIALDVRVHGRGRGCASCMSSEYMEGIGAYTPRPIFRTSASKLRASNGCASRP
jgi:hypothetical protein